MANSETKLNIIVDAQDRTAGTFRNLENQLDRSNSSLSSVGGTAAKLVAGFYVLKQAFDGVSGFLATGFNVAAQLETAEVGLKTLLGSADAAAKTVARLKTEAARTPFELPGLTQATQLLTSVTKDGDKSIDILLNVGEALAAMGKGQTELDRIIVNLQQVAATGKAASIDIKQFAFAGIPIYEMLEEYFAKNPVKVIENHNKEIGVTASKLSTMKDQLRIATMQMGEFSETTKDSTRAAKALQISNLQADIAAMEGTMSKLNTTNGAVSTSVMSIEEAIESGAVTFEVLTDLFDKANDSGGKFFNAFKNQSGTFNQAFSNMKDSFGIFAADFVEKSGAFDGVIRVMQTLALVMTNYEGVIRSVHEGFNNLMAGIDEKTGLISLLSQMWANLVFVYQTLLKPALVELWATLQPMKPFLEALAKVFGATIVIAIGAVILILGTLAIALTGLLTGAAKVANFFYGTFGDAWTWITDKIAASIEVVEKFVTLMKKAVSLVGSLPGKVGSSIGNVLSVNDAVISPSGTLISTHPDDYIIATKDPASLSGGGTNIYVTGNTLLDANSAELIGDLILDQLQLSSAM